MNISTLRIYTTNNIWNFSQKLLLPEFGDKSNLKTISNITK